MKRMRMQLTILILLIGIEFLLCQGLQNKGCSHRCKECSKLTGKCRRCEPGWWGSNCHMTCLDDHCYQDTCEINSGLCTYGCKDGWYIQGHKCLPCKSNCFRCTNQSQCIVCKGAKFGDNCTRDCEHPCTQCEQTYTDNAYGASFHSNCLSCAEGMFGGSLGCYYECSSCIDNACSIDNCTYGCKEGFYHFGSRLCVRCFPGCASCNGLSFRDKTCLTCKPGKWGDICDKDCHKLCPQKICNQTSGKCLCEDGYYLNAEGSCEKCLPSCLTCQSENLCTSCGDGIFGEQCENRCSGNCLECSSDGLTCKSCPTEHYMKYNRCYPCDIGCSSCWWMKLSQKLECTKCKEGFYKDVITGRFITKCFPCPTGCSSCNRTGECQSCMPGFHLFHRRCCPNNCIACSKADRCTICVDGYFGSSCDKQCKKTCQKCYSQDECDSCKVDYYSDSQNGEHTCGCTLNECSNRSEKGICQSCRKVGWYTRGEGCCECSKCKNNYCDANGKCLDGCPSASKFGAFCNLECSKAIPGCMECIGGDFQNVQCLKCVSSAYLAVNSCHTCSNKCLDLKCTSSGTCSLGCIAGWYGSFCDIKCDESCINYIQNMSNFYIKLLSLLSDIFKYK